MIIIPEQDRVKHVQLRNPLYSYVFTGPEYPQVRPYSEPPLGQVG